MYAFRVEVAFQNMLKLGFLTLVHEEMSPPGTPKANRACRAMHKFFK